MASLPRKTVAPGAWLRPHDVRLAHGRRQMGKGRGGAASAAGSFCLLRAPRASPRKHLIDPREQTLCRALLARARWLRRVRVRACPSGRGVCSGDRGGRRIAPCARRQIFVHGPIAKFGQEIKATTVSHEPRHFAVGIAKVTEMPRAGRAGPHACGNAVVGGKVLIVDAVDAPRALLHDTVAQVVLARPVRAGPGAQLAADTGVGIDQHDAVLRPFVGGARRAHSDTVGFLAMQARAGKIHGPTLCALASLKSVDAIKPGAMRIGAVGVLIGERGRIPASIPFLAAGRTGVAPDAGIEVDDQAQLRLSCGGKRGHRSTPSRAGCPLPTGGACWRPSLAVSPGGGSSGANCGKVVSVSSAPTLAMETLRSYQAAWPVMGSALA